MTRLSSVSPTLLDRTGRLSQGVVFCPISSQWSLFDGLGSWRTGSTSRSPTARAIVKASGSRVNITCRYAAATGDVRPMRVVGGLRSSQNRWGYDRKLRCSRQAGGAPSARRTLSEHCGEERCLRHLNPRGCVGENCKWTANGRGWTRWDHGRLALSGATSADSERDIRQRNVTPPDALTRPHNPKAGGSNPSPATNSLYAHALHEPSQPEGSFGFARAPFWGPPHAPVCPPLTRISGAGSTPPASSLPAKGSSTPGDAPERQGRVSSNEGVPLG